MLELPTLKKCLQNARVASVPIIQFHRLLAVLVARFKTAKMRNLNLKKDYQSLKKITEWAMTSPLSFKR